MIAQATEPLDGDGFTGAAVVPRPAPPRPPRRHAGQVAVRRPGHARRRADERRAVVDATAFAQATATVRIASRRDERRWSPRRCRLAATRRPRRAVVRRSDVAGLPDPARRSRRHTVERHGGVAADAPSSACTAAPRATSPCSWRPVRTSSRCRSSADLVEWAGYITRFLDDGGIDRLGRRCPTDGPIPSTADRHWRALSDVWCSLVQLGCDPSCSASRASCRRSAGCPVTRSASPGASPGSRPTSAGG